MTNYNLAVFVVTLKVASKSHLKSIKIKKTTLNLLLLEILYKNGVIRGFSIANDFEVLIYLKYYQNRPVVFDINLISTPGKRVYWSLGKLSLVYNAHSFSGFYIISTPIGLVTSNDCLLGGHLAGEILLKVSM
jgi:small subunit ribosomal protein S8